MFDRWTDTRQNKPEINTLAETKDVKSDHSHFSESHGKETFMRISEQDVCRLVQAKLQEAD